MLPTAGGEGMQMGSLRTELDITAHFADDGNGKGLRPELEEPYSGKPNEDLELDENMMILGTTPQ